MDQIIIDLTDVPTAGVESQIELISNDPTSPCALPRLAKLANSSCYEMLTRLSSRLTRRYVELEVSKEAVVPVPVAVRVAGRDR